MCARMCAFLKWDMFYNIKICYNAEKRMKYTICVQNMCRMSAEFVQNKEIRYGIRIKTKKA